MHLLNCYSHINVKKEKFENKYEKNDVKIKWFVFIIFSFLFSMVQKTSPRVPVKVNYHLRF